MAARRYQFDDPIPLTVNFLWQDDLDWSSQTFKRSQQLLFGWQYADPYWERGPDGGESQKVKKFHVLYWCARFSLLRAGGFSCSLDVLFGNLDPIRIGIETNAVPQHWLGVPLHVNVCCRCWPRCWLWLEAVVSSAPLSPRRSRLPTCPSSSQPSTHW